MLLSIRKFVFAATVIALIATDCARSSEETVPASLPTIPAWHLLLDSQTFPKDWEIDPCSPADRLCFGESHAGREFGIVGVPGHVVQDVYRLNDVASAHSLFQKARDTDFKRAPLPRSPTSLFLPPSEITYRSPIADEYHLGCGVDVVPACEAIVRYGNYFVEFFFNVDRGYVDGAEIKGNGLKIEEIEPILRAMDEKAASVLGIPLPKTP